MIPGLPTMPPLNLATNATSGAKSGDFLGGPVNVTFEEWVTSTGSGSAKGGGVDPIYLLGAAALVVLWLIKRNKAA